jgi:glycine betaine/choline ABC-type transport system substrate-binding protein
MDRKTAVCIAVALLVTSCSGGRQITVGSKNFTEQVLLGEIIAQQIERKLHVRVDRKLNLGGTLLAHQALTSKSIDVYPEYTGTALTAVLKLQASGDAAQVRATVRDEYNRRWQLAWLDPLGFNNTFAMIVRNDENVRTLSEAAQRPQPWKLGVGYEFLTRPDGLAGLQKTYGLRIDGSPVTMDLGLLYSALQGRQIEMGAASSTDGLLATLPIRVLADDKHYFPPYECAIVVRQDTMETFPELRPVLERLSGKISDETMRRLNSAVDGSHRPVREVAAEFLKSVDP